MPCLASKTNKTHQLPLDPACVLFLWHSVPISPRFEVLREKYFSLLSAYFCMDWSIFLNEMEYSRDGSGASLFCLFLI